MKIQIQNPNTSKPSAPPEMMKAACTGDVLMVLPDDMNVAAAARTMKQAGFSAAVSSDFRSGKTRIPDLGEDLDAVIYASLGICLIRGAAAGTAMAAMNKRSGQSGILMEPERYVRAFGIPDYLAGYPRRRGRRHRAPGRPRGRAPQPRRRRNARGLRGIAVDLGPADHRRARRVLDRRRRPPGPCSTPDSPPSTRISRAGASPPRCSPAKIRSRTCRATAPIASAPPPVPRPPPRAPRYGVACEAEIFAGKVLDDSGSGTDGDIIKGIEWAVMNKCAVISMSLGAPVYGPGHSRAFENLARRALKAGTLIVAAAGNESYRPDQVAPVAHPANCPSILSVAAVDPALQVAFFSCGGVYGDGGQVDIAAPGVDVYSSWPEALGSLHHRMPGTSMAAPHVAGVAALLAQSDASLRGRALWDALKSRSQALPLPERDVGVGLVRVS
jgi:subtilisin family serine protease